MIKRLAGSISQLVPILALLTSACISNLSAQGDSSGTRFVPVAPCRIADTRNAAGPYGGPILRGQTSRTFSVPGSPCGIPPFAQAFSLNITAIPSGPLGFLTVWPAGLTQPLVSTLNSNDGRIVANAAIVGAGAAGGVGVFAPNDTHVVIDIDGYFDAQSAAALPFYTLPPCRIVDTRNPTGPSGGPSLLRNNPRIFNVGAGNCGIPGDAQAYSLNATVVPAEPLGFLTLWPSTQPQPLVSTLNSVDGRVVANAAIVSGISGSVSAVATGNTDLVLDTNGHFGGTTSSPALSYFPIEPCRVADTRNPAGSFGGPANAAGATRSFAIPQSVCGIPSNAHAYALNVTAVPRGILQFLTIWPSDQPRPFVSTLNSFQGAVVANAAIVPAAADGSVSVYTSDASDVVLDINGYFASEQPLPGDPGFTISLNPLTRTITAGDTASYEVTITSQNGFAGQVLLALFNPTNNLSSATFTRDTIMLTPNGTTTSTLTLVSKPTGPFGAATMSVVAGSTGSTTQRRDFTLTVNPPAAAASPAQVSIRQFQFSPTPVNVTAGAQVTWTNFDAGIFHTVVADGGQFASTALANGQTFSTMPATPGTYNYHCSIHPFMTGTVVVR